MQFICPRSLPFWQECSGFLGGSADLVGVADMCTAAHSDVANALAAGHCTVSDTPGRKCHGTCPQEGGHDQAACEAVRGNCCSWAEGTDSSCTDDPMGVVAAGGATCGQIVMLGCTYDVSAMVPTAPTGTLISALCPLSCDMCGH